MSSTPMPAAKRRRVDAANETLKKPFRSPMVKRPQPQHDIPSWPATPADAQKRDNRETARFSTPSRLLDRRCLGPSFPIPSSSFVTPSKAVPKVAPGRELDGKLKGASDKDKELLFKLSQRREDAEARTREVEKEIELVSQAARIESRKETTNDNLEKLVRKWKSACRTAAKELFDMIRGRVDSMGGGAAWRDTQQHNAWFDQDLADERKLREEAGEGADDREELEGLEEVQKSEDENEQDEERDFTMHMMLKSLNIDPKIVGYDPVEDKWRDWG